MAFMEVNFFSDVLGMCMSMYVVLPQKTRGNIGVKEGETGAEIPTLYLLHGMSDDHTIWMRRTSVERYAEERGIAVVMPTTYLGWYTDMKYGYNYRTFIGDELPKICRSFFPQLSKKREDTYVAGLSMGGYGTLALALTYPETFSIACPLSAAFDPTHLYDPAHPENTFFTDIFGSIDEFAGSCNDLYHMAKVRKEDGSPLPALYIAVGTEDFLLADNRKMHLHLLSLGYDLIYSEKPGVHNWAFWDKEIQNVLDFICARRAKKEA
ncbi:MAG: esterase family protein [Clostridia bacterium]|nr:esterase family protein [Clostridia bacterium]